MPAAIMLAGAVMMIRTRAFFVLHPVGFVRTLSGGGSRGGVGSWAALSVSLAGVLGVGNIAGVCVAMALGGPGAVFWMWASAFLSVPLKYAEIYLGVKYGGGGGSPMLYTEGLRGGKAVARLYAALCLFSALTLGNVTQTGAAASALSNAFSVPAPVTGAVIAAVSAFIIIGRFEKLARLTSALVPLMSAAYIALCLSVIICRADRLPDAVASVFANAFSGRAASGGAAGWCFASALRHGTVKGCFSHEAGSGTAVFAHSHAGASPEKQACFGIFEVFFDTAVVCSLTAFAVLTSGVDIAGYSWSGTKCVLSAFSGVLGGGAGRAVSLCISLFAFATVLCWSSYGLTALNYLSHGKGKAAYLAVYCAAAAAAPMIESRAIWALTDISVLSLTALNLITLLRRRNEIYPPEFI